MKLTAEYPYPVEKRLVGKHPVRTQRVQYGETDFDFLQRLMQVGHLLVRTLSTRTATTLVLADAIEYTSRRGFTGGRMASKGLKAG